MSACDCEPTTHTDGSLSHASDCAAYPWCPHETGMYSCLIPCGCECVPCRRLSPPVVFEKPTRKSRLRGRPLPRPAADPDRQQRGAAMTITDRTGEDDATFAALLARVEAADDAPESVRWRVAVALNDDGAYCGDCDYEDGLACSGCRSTCLSYADAALGVLRGEGRQA